MKRLIACLFAITLIGCETVSTAGGVSRNYVLNNADSKLTFISTKNIDIAETHRFKTLTGFVVERDRAELVIDLASVDTAIPIRDERMLEHLFEVASFAAAEIAVDLKEVDTAGLSKGSSMESPVSLTLDLHGNTQTLSAEVVVTRRANGGLLVQSAQPVVVNANSFGLAGGIEILKNLVALSSIGAAVPVSFTLSFDPA